MNNRIYSKKSKEKSKKYFLDSKHQRVHNFYPGPSMLPVEVIDRINQDLYNWKGLGVNPMEIGHRTVHFIELYQKIVADLKEIMNINDDYEVLLMHGGATAQYAAIPMNIKKKEQKASYVISGHWSNKAMAEFKTIYGNKNLEIAADAGEFNFKKLPDFLDWKINKQSSYIYYTANETIHGIAYKEDVNQALSLSEIRDLPPLVCDYTSSLLTQKIDVNRYGIIFASSQKSLGIAGVTLVIIHKTLLAQTNLSAPSILNYQKLAKSGSMLNTPNTFSWYVMSLVLDWVKRSGGVESLYQNNCAKADLLYKTVDQSSIYFNDVAKKYRSLVNVCFRIKNQDLEQKFITEAEKSGLVGLKGHRVFGGIRASMYNAMTLSAIVNLTGFMKEFEYTHHNQID